MTINIIKELNTNFTLILLLLLEISFQQNYFFVFHNFVELQQENEI